VQAVSDEVILSAPAIAADGRPIAAPEGDAALLYACASDDLARIGDGLGLAPAQVEIDVRFGAPVDVLRAVEAECDRALLVMATHGYSGLRRSALGSVAPDILHHGRLPVLLVRPLEHTDAFTPQRITEDASAEGSFVSAAALASPSSVRKSIRGTQWECC
jgi:nucleotide-binding universal stress UspA family protein